MDEQLLQNMRALLCDNSRNDFVRAQPLLSRLSEFDESISRKCAYTERSGGVRKIERKNRNAPGVSES
jgi:hypothetical protein